MELRSSTTNHSTYLVQRRNSDSDWDCNCSHCLVRDIDRSAMPFFLSFDDVPLTHVGIQAIVALVEETLINCRLRYPRRSAGIRVRSNIDVRANAAVISQTVKNLISNESEEKFGACFRFTWKGNAIVGRLFCGRAPDICCGVVCENRSCAML